MRTSWSASTDDAHSGNDWVFGVAGGVFALVGVVLAVVAVWTGVATHSFLSSAEHADGVVLANASHYSCSDSGRNRTCGTTFRPVVRFAVDGRSYTFTEGAGTSDWHEEGSQVRVAYDPSDPHHARLLHGFWGNYLATVICGGLAVVFGGLGLLLLVLWVRSRAKRSSPSAPEAVVQER